MSRSNPTSPRKPSGKRPSPRSAALRAAYPLSPCESILLVAFATPWLRFRDADVDETDAAADYRRANGGRLEVAHRLTAECLAAQIAYDADRATRWLTGRGLGGSWSTDAALMKLCSLGLVHFFVKCSRWGGREFLFSVTADGERVAAAYREELGVLIDVLYSGDE